MEDTEGTEGFFNGRVDSRDDAPIHGLKTVSGDLAGDVEWPPGATDRSTKPSVPSVRAFPILRFTGSPEPVLNPFNGFSAFVL
jgi:hypothetical protein